jgi:hypothetical protein
VPPPATRQRRVIARGPAVRSRHAARPATSHAVAGRSAISLQVAAVVTLAMITMLADLA